MTSEQEQRAAQAASLPLLDRSPPAPFAWALGLGLVSATGFAPLGLWPLAIGAMAGAVLLLARAPGWRQAAILGWLFGLAHFTLGNNWIATAFTHQAKMPATLGWAAVPVLAAYLAIYPALAAGAARAMVPGHRRAGPSVGFVLVFAGCWVGAEWLRATLFTGYSWNPLAMVLLGGFDRPGLALLAPWFGTYALSGVVVMLAGLVASLAQQRRWLALIAVIALLAAGMLRPVEKGPDSALGVTIVQPAIRQDHLNDPWMYEANFQRLADLSARPALQEGQSAQSPRIVLWPESGMVDYLREGYPQAYYDATTALGSPAYARRRLGAAVGPGSVLLTGAVDLEFAGDDRRSGLHGARPAASPASRAIGARNAVSMLAADGTLLAGYFKAHLVPFGEYLPLRPFLEPLGLSRLVPGSIDFWPGPGPLTFDLGAHGRAGIQICYEIIFSGRVTEPGDRPDYLFNPSNDGWFGRFGPPQHLAQARMRAIEEGLPVLRSTTTGISALIDADGVVRAHLGDGAMGRIDAMVPAARAPTLFARLGNGLALGWGAFFLGLGLVALRRGQRY